MLPKSSRDLIFIRDLLVTFPSRYPFVIALILLGDYPLVLLGAGMAALPRVRTQVHRSARSSPGRTVSERRVHETQDSVGRTVLGGLARPGRVRRKRRLDSVERDPDQLQPGG